MHKGAKDFLHGLNNFSPRDHWWNLLDLWEARRGFRRIVYASLILALVGASLAMFVYPWWERTNSIKMVRQWLDADKVGKAAMAAQEGINLAPGNPEAWILSAECARRANDFNRALVASQMAAKLDPTNLNSTLYWASDALRIDRPDLATRALATVPQSVLAQSGWGLRLKGEIARLQNEQADARRFFEAAVRLDGTTPVGEVPLGIVLLGDPDEAVRQRGRDLLARWSDDPKWGGMALRTETQ
ncbi:MAG: hypothetical protein K9N01_10220 [Cephaloticoccus sp.]|nr:hypothetical protein [Cephaloticoccus sp.]